MFDLVRLFLSVLHRKMKTNKKKVYQRTKKDPPIRSKLGVQRMRSADVCNLSSLIVLLHFVQINASRPLAGYVCVSVFSPCQLQGSGKRKRSRKKQAEKNESVETIVHVMHSLTGETFSIPLSRFLSLISADDTNHANRASYLSALNQRRRGETNASPRLPSCTCIWTSPSSTPSRRSRPRRFTSRLLPH